MMMCRSIGIGKVRTPARPPFPCLLILTLLPLVLLILSPGKQQRRRAGGVDDHGTVGSVRGGREEAPYGIGRGGARRLASTPPFSFSSSPRLAPTLLLLVLLVRSSGKQQRWRAGGADAPSALRAGPGSARGPGMRGRGGARRSVRAPRPPFPRILVFSF